MKYFFHPCLFFFDHLMPQMTSCPKDYIKSFLAQNFFFSYKEFMPMQAGAGDTI